MSTVISFGFLLITGIYAVSMIRRTIAWVIYKNPENNKKIATPVKVTVVLPVRNESGRIEACLTSLAMQQYPAGFLEVIISDDFSDDTTVQIVRNFIEAEKSSGISFRILQSRPDDSGGKKNALERAIKIASGELIMTTDADCTMQAQWVSSVADCYCASGASMITGFVKLHPWKSFLEMLQSLEFLSLSGAGAVSVILQKPLMCNGANLAFNKEAFFAAGGYDYGGNLPTGDDTFLMLRMAASRNGSVVFNKDTRSVVTSLPVSGFNELLAQRKRWASKITAYREGYIKRTGIFFFAVNFILLISLGAAISGWWNAGIVLLMWLVKFSGDFLFLVFTAQFAAQRQLLLLFLPAAIIYPFYALAGLIFSSGSRSYKWKGRMYNAD